MNLLHRVFFFIPKTNVNRVKMDSVDKNRSPSAKNQSSVIRLSESANKKITQPPFDWQMR